MFEDDESEGLSLEEALKKYFAPAQYAEAQELRELMDTAAEYNPVLYARLKLKWRQIREPLEVAFRQELESGNFVLCGREYGGGVLLWGMQRAESLKAVDPRWLQGASIDYDLGIVRYDMLYYDNVRVFGVTPFDLLVERIDVSTDCLDIKLNIDGLTRLAAELAAGDAQAREAA
jgi:hypothetical protein